MTNDTQVTHLSSRATRVPHRRSAWGALLLLPLVATLFCSPAHADDSTTDITWADVQAAEQNEAAAQALADQIDAQLDSVEQRAAELGDASVTASAAAETARQGLDAAQSKVDELDASVLSAQQTSDAALHAAGSLIVAQMRNGYGLSDTLQLLNTSDPDAMLSQLALASRVAGITGDVIDTAQKALSAYQSLSDQAAAARDELAQRSEEANQAAEDAQAASVAASTSVAEVKATHDDLYAKLAELQGTTADAIAAYRQQEAEQASYLEQQASAQQQADQSQQTSSGTETATTNPTTSDQTSSGGSAGSSTSAAAGTGSETPAAQPADAGNATTGTGSSSSSSTVDNSRAAAKAYAQSRMSSYGWDDSQYACLVSLWTRESGWSYTATNSSSGAYGIPQALPGSKMASAGADWQTNSQTQIDWGLGYISSVYGTPCGAWQHSENTGWY